MKEQVLIEKIAIDGYDIKAETPVEQPPQIAKLLGEGWQIKQMEKTEVALFKESRTVFNPSHIILTFWLQKP
jgi:hypothetical protein